MTSDPHASRRRLLVALGAGAAGLAGCVTDKQAKQDPETGGAPPELEIDADLPPADRAQAAWTAAREAKADTQEATATRLEASVTIEQAVREAAVVVPLYRDLAERFWRDRVEIPDGVVPGTGWYNHTGTTAPGEELTILTGPFFSLDPIEWAGPPTGPLAAVYETLTAVEGRTPNQLLAEAERADDGLTRRLELRSNVAFHNGRPLRAADVVYSWRRAIEADPELAAPWPRGLGLAVERTSERELVAESLTENLRAVDERTVELRLTEQNPDLLGTIAESDFAVLPEGLVGDVTGYEGRIEQEQLAETGSVGTGPFAIEAVDLDGEIRLRRADQYHGPTPTVERLRWLVREGDAAWTAVLDGRADIFDLPDFAYDRGVLAAETTDRGRRSGTYGPVDLLGEPVRYRAQPTRTTVYLGANAARVSPAVRQAIAELLDREQLIELAGGRRVPAGTVAPPRLWPTASDRDGDGPYRRALATDPYGRGEARRAAARERLRSAGIGPDSSVAYTLTVPESEPLQSIAESLAERLKELGVELAIESVSTLSITDHGEAGRLELWLAGLWWADTALATELSRLAPENTNTRKMPERADGLYLNWQTELDSR